MADRRSSFEYEDLLKCGRGELFVSLLPDARGAGLVKQLGDAEVAREFQVRPVIERVAEGERNRARPGHELVERAGFACAERFAHAICAHGTPLVVITFEPDLEQVGELSILGTGIVELPSKAKK